MSQNPYGQQPQAEPDLYARALAEGELRGRQGRVKMWIVLVIVLVVAVGSWAIGLTTGAAVSGAALTTTTGPKPTVSGTVAQGPAPAPTTTTVVENLKEKALDQIIEQVKNRASLAPLSRDDMRNLMDNLVCANKDDIIVVSQRASSFHITSGDAGYLVGANAVIGYC